MFPPVAYLSVYLFVKTVQKVADDFFILSNFISSTDAKLWMNYQQHIKHYFLLLLCIV